MAEPRKVTEPVKRGPGRPRKVVAAAPTEPPPFEPPKRGRPKKAIAEVTALAPVSNDAQDIIAKGEPYGVKVRLEGTTQLLFHRWSVEAVAEKAKAAKGSAAKKTDDVESYVYRNDEGFICLPAEYVRQSIIWAAKYKQDPRSPRKSAMDLFKAAITPAFELASLGSKDWDYLDQRRVSVQRNGVTRMRPAFNTGWTAEFEFLVLLPDYVDASLLNEVLVNAGRLIGVGDFRPTYGRFAVTLFEVIELTA